MMLEPKATDSNYLRRSDETEIQRLLSTFEIDEAAKADLRRLQPIVAANIDMVLTQFYEKILSDPAMVSVFGENASMPKAKAKQREHWLDWVFLARFDAEYLTRCKRIGRAHKVHGVLPAYYLFGYHFMSRNMKSLILEKFPDRHEADRLISSVEKALFLDIDLAISVYCSEMTEDWRQSSLYDSLTGILNRRGIAESLKKTLSEARLYSAPVTVALLDIDHFKKVNDTYGHSAGDIALSRVAELISASMRDGDIVGRWGGEEFIIVMHDTNLDEGREVAERVRRHIDTLEIQLDETTMTLTASLGISELTPNEQTIEPVVARADTALYAAKRAGRNRVECAAVV